MTVFELQTSGIGSDYSANWATAIAQRCAMFLTKILKMIPRLCAIKQDAVLIRCQFQVNPVENWVGTADVPN